jgi:hypothetical protein
MASDSPAMAVRPGFFRSSLDAWRISWKIME